MKKSLPSHRAFSLIELSIVILIIGIIVAGITQGSRLVRQFKITTAQTATQSSGVNSIPNLAMWLEPTSPTGLQSATNGDSPIDGDKISDWFDINPQTNKSHATQATDANRPTYLTMGIGGLPSAVFANSGSYAPRLYNASTPPILPGNTRYTIILVWKPVNSLAGAGGTVFAQGGYSGTSNTWGSIGFGAAGNPIRFSNGTSGAYASSGVTAVLNTAYITTVVVDTTVGANGTAYVYNNKSASPTATVALGTSGVIGNSAYAIGGGIGTDATDNQTNSSQNTNSWISEIIVFNRNLKQNEIDDIQTYLSKKYRITLS